MLLFAIWLPWRTAGRVGLSGEMLDPQLAVDRAGDMSVAVLDDDPSAMELMCVYLQQAGYQLLKEYWRHRGVRGAQKLREHHGHPGDHGDGHTVQRW